VVSFEVRGSLESASKFIDALRMPYIAPSLGGVESLVEQPTIVSYWDKTPAERAALGIRDNLVRYSCGIEDAEALIRHLDQALGLTSISSASAAFSSASSRRFASSPPEKPPSLPCAAITRWQGIRMGTGFAPVAVPAARTALVRPAALATSA